MVKEQQFDGYNENRTRLIQEIKSAEIYANIDGSLKQTIKNLLEILKTETERNIEIEILNFRSHLHAIQQATIVNSDVALTIRVSTCNTKEDFLKLFSSLEIPDNKWRSSEWLRKNKFYGLIGAIVKNGRFEKGGWKSFLRFMDGEKDFHDETSAVPMTQRVAACIERKDFIDLFTEVGLDNDNWQNSKNFRGAGTRGLYQAIVDDPRFKKIGWKGFLQFMSVERDIPMTERVAKCIEISDFLALFKAVGIPGDNWKKSRWFEDNDIRALYLAIIYDQRFKKSGWKGFLRFMEGKDIKNIERDIPMTERVGGCIEPSDFLALFKAVGIPDDNWKNTEWLENNGYRNLYKIFRNDTRFKSWEDFLNFMEAGEIEQQLNIISNLNLEELFSIFADRPGQMKLYLQANYPNLTEEEIDKLILRGFKSFFGGSERKAEYLDYDFTLPPIDLEDLPFETEDNTICISGIAKGAQYVYVSGIGNRRIKVDDQGYFKVIVPLRIGKMNIISLTAVNVDEKARSETSVIEIEQTGTVDDIEELIKLLSGMGKDAIDGIKVDPGRYNHIKSRLKHVLIRKFSKSFDEGERYIREMMDGNHSSVIKRMLREILSEFRKIDKATFPNIRPEEQLYLFQKYCALLIQERIQQRRPGVILANDPGLGKTRTALAAINGDDAVIIAPNSVVSGWSEEAAKTMKNPDILVMQDMPSSKRKEVLRATTARHRITNIQFIQQHEDDERIELLANEDSIIVQDEAHSRANLQSKQTKGMRKLSKIGKFQLLLSATPFKNSKTTRRVLHTLHPDRPEFSSDSAFEKAFPSKDPKALQTVNLLLEEDMIRFTKRDALEEMDPNIPVSKQRHKLPRKEQVPPEIMGGFEMSNEQAYVIYEMFLNWPEWTRKYGQYVPNDKAAKLDRIYNGDALSKRHAYRQVINNPDFVGLNGVSNQKARQLQAIVTKSLKEGRKVEIFCAYNAQANLYAEILRKFKPALYTGVTSAEGWKKENGKPQFFAKDKKGNWRFDENGYPIADQNGEPMLAMDYERLSFQNAPDRKVIIATYAAGAVGTTFTAAKAVIKDDLPRDCIEDEQSDDRTHRIDHEHQTHHTINHYHLISSYPQKFLNAMKKRWVVKQPDKTYREYRTAEEAMIDAEYLDATVQTAYEAFFEQGTWDEVHFGNLKTQRHMMHLILDGIADESILNEDQVKLRGIDD